MKIIKGKTTEERIKHIDTILSRFSRRLHRTTAAVLTPTLVSDYKEFLDNDVCLRTMFPVNGEIIIGAVFVEKMPKGGVDIHAVISNQSSSRKESMFTKRQLTVVRPKVAVPAFNRVSLTMISRSEEEIRGVWSSLMWTPEIRGAVIRRFIIDELDKVEREYALLEEE